MPPIWNPHTSSQINHLERIQHYAANSRTKFLNWQTNILIRTRTHKTSTQTEWTVFRDNLTTLMNNTIPHGNTKAKTHLQWISRELIRMQRRRNKSHKKAKQTGLNKHLEQFRELGRHTTKALETSYKCYVNNQIGDSLKTNPKRLAQTG